MISHTRMGNCECDMSFDTSFVGLVGYCGEI